MEASVTVAIAAGVVVAGAVGVLLVMRARRAAAVRHVAAPAAPSRAQRAAEWVPVVLGSIQGIRALFDGSKPDVRSYVGRDGTVTLLEPELHRAPDVPPAVRLRVGVHTGTVVGQRDDLLGANVALAARVAGTARGGEVVVSSAVRERLADDPGFAFDRGRSVRLKGIPGRHRLHRAHPR